MDYALQAIWLVAGESVETSARQVSQLTGGGHRETGRLADWRLGAEGRGGLWINAKCRDGPVQTNKVRCSRPPSPSPSPSTPAPAAWVLGLQDCRGTGGQWAAARERGEEKKDWSGGFGTLCRCAGVQARYCCCRLVGWHVLMAPGCVSHPWPCAHSPPMGAFQKQGRKLQESMGALDRRKPGHGAHATT